MTTLPNGAVCKCPSVCGCHKPSPADELRAAAAKLRAPLPALVAMVPRVVQGDSETMSALAWCEDHTNWISHGRTRAPDDAETSACFNCDTAELIYPALAELIRDLLAAREQMAAWLGLFAAMYEQRMVDTPGSRYATDVARAVNGSQP